LDGEEKEYYDSLSEKEKKAFHIAQKMLQSSFTTYKTSGFLEWKKKKNIS
jgi:hypothetical protein